jgi:hypothetical protein
MKKPHVKNLDSKLGSELNYHDYILAGISPEDERDIMRATRKRARKEHGFTEEDLDEMYGVDSREE